MSAVIVILVLVGLIVGLGVASLLGWTPDTRDPEWSLGRIIRHDGQ